MLAVAGCTGPAPTPPPPEALLAHAAHDFDTVQSLHFVIDFSGSPTYLDSGHTMILRHIEGDVVRPDRMRAMVKVAMPGVFVQIAAIGIGERQFATDPLNNKWEEIPTEWGFNPRGLFAVDGGLTAVLLGVRNFAAMTDEAIAGQGHYHLRGTVGGEEISRLLGSLEAPADLTIDIWVGESDFYMRRIKLVDAQLAGTDPTTWLMELSDFNKPVTIEPPAQFTPLAH